MAKDLYIVPECYVDTNMVETLLAVANTPTHGVNHQHGCNTVVNTMRKMKGNVAVGVIDNDKRRVSYLDECREIASLDHIKLFRHKVDPHYIFLISPAMDGLMLDAATFMGVDVSLYGFSSNLKDFTEKTKSIQANNDPAIKRLIKSLKDYSELVAFRNALSYIKQNRFQIDEDCLKSFFL